MSADNYIGIYLNKENDTWVVCHGFMSPADDDCQYRGNTISVYGTREIAAVAALDALKREDVVEYGVIELDEIPEDWCGRCYTCIHERKYIDETIDRCDGCNEPFTSSDWRSLTVDGMYHRNCKPQSAFIERIENG
jgi:hypothetical protein